MAITFIKPTKFNPKDVKDECFDIDSNWSVKNLSFVNETQTEREDHYTYRLQLFHKKTERLSETMKMLMKIYKQDTYGGRNVEVQIQGLDNPYGYGYSLHQEKTKNIYIFLKTAIKNIEFVKCMFGMRHRTQRETHKAFGKIFLKYRR
jgi:hypothetical protein